MFSSSSSVRASGPMGLQDIWDALLYKAEHPVGIVPSATNSEVLERFNGGFVRQMTAGGGLTVRERITFTPSVQVLYDRIDSPGSEGFILNTLSDLAGLPLLVFTVAVNFPNVDPGSQEEIKAGEQLLADYRGAMKLIFKRAAAHRKMLDRLSTTKSALSRPGSAQLARRSIFAGS